MLMVTTVVLFPVLLAQFGLTLLVLNGADSSAILSADARQVLVLLLTVLLLALGLVLVTATCSRLIDVASVEGEHEEGEERPEVTADDALKGIRSGLREFRAGDGPLAPAGRSLIALLIGYVVVYLAGLWLTGNELTIGTAFLMMCGLFVVGSLLSPVPATALWLSRSGYEPPVVELEPEPELKPDPELEEASKAIKAGVPGSIAPPGSTAEPSTSIAPPGSVPPEPEPAPEPAPAITPATPFEQALMAAPEPEPEPEPEPDSVEDDASDGPRGSVPPPV